MTVVGTNRQCGGGELASNAAFGQLAGFRFSPSHLGTHSIPSFATKPNLKEVSALWIFPFDMADWGIAKHATFCQRALASLADNARNPESDISDLVRVQDVEHLQDRFDQWYVLNALSYSPPVLALKGPQDSVEHFD